MQAIFLNILYFDIEQLYRKLGLQLQLRARANPVSRGDFVTQCTSTTQSSQNLLFLLHPLIPNIYPSQKKAKINFGFGLFRWLSSNGCMCVTHFFPFLVDSLLLLSLMEYVNRFALCASARRRRLSVVAAATPRAAILPQSLNRGSSRFLSVIYVE